ncbi:MAG TPA: hypothetical protein HPP97_03030 [Desulfuromonadales bacterium]|nr:hypothetical protein [Desulfuromonadales bacterium]
MQLEKTTVSSFLRILPTLGLTILLSGCAGRTSAPANQNGYVEINNPSFTMSPGSPEKIWVPREDVEKGVPRGGEVIKRGYESLKGTVSTTPEQSLAPNLTPSQAGITEPAGKSANIVQKFGLVVAVDGDKVYFNLGREAGYFYGQTLKVHRGGTVIEGLGLAPGELIGKVEVLGYVGTNGGYGTLKQGGPVRINDLVGIE